MRRDPLAILQRVRDAAVVEATRELASGLQREQAGVQRLAEHTETILREQAEVEVPDTLDFAAWLPHARAVADSNARSLAADTKRVGRLRQALLAKQTEAAAVGKAIERRQAEVSLARSRREQAAMDEVAGRRRPER